MRKYVLRWGILAVLAAVLIAAGPACKNSTEADNPLFEKSFISTSTQGHAHDVKIWRKEIETPYDSGVSRATSLVNAHVHTFSMTQAQCLTVNGGATLDIESSVDSGHSHTFSIKKWF